MQFLKTLLVRIWRTECAIDTHRSVCLHLHQKPLLKDSIFYYFVFHCDKNTGSHVNIVMCKARYKNYICTLCISAHYEKQNYPLLKLDVFVKQGWFRWQLGQNLAISVSPTFWPGPTEQRVQPSFKAHKTYLVKSTLNAWIERHTFTYFF